MKNESAEVVEPDIEIVIRTGDREICLIGIFKVRDNEFDVIVGIDEADTRAGIQSALQLGIDAVSRAHFMATGSIGGEGSAVLPPPF